MQAIDIQMLPYTASANEAEMEQITNIVNRVYAATEESLWKPGTLRTTVEEVAELTRSGEMAAARSEGRIVGCIRVRKIDEATGEFGMLAVDDEYQGSGIGRKLIHFAEQKCLNERLQKMQLELLVPQEGSHPDKAILESWYTRIGYRPDHTESVDASFPQLADMLAIPCKLIVFQKELQHQAQTTV